MYTQDEGWGKKFLALQKAHCKEKMIRVPIDRKQCVAFCGWILSIFKDDIHSSDLPCPSLWLTIWGALFSFYNMFRHEELRTLQWKHWRQIKDLRAHAFADEDEGRLAFLVVNSKHRGRKNIHRDSKHEAFVDMILSDFDTMDPVDVYRRVYQDWVRRMRRQPTADDNIFPGWSKVKANKLLQRGAVELDFPRYELGMEFGWHCWRTGKAEDNVCRLNLPEAERCKRARWKSIKAESSYVGNRLFSECDNSLLHEQMQRLANTK
jgi:hypothetical protein